MLCHTLRVWHYQRQTFNVFAEAEFTSSIGQFVFSAGDNVSCVSVTPTDDDIVEDDKVFSVTLETTDRALAPSADDTPLTITDNDSEL